MALAKDYEFASERLRYRGIAAGDAADIVRWRSDPANYRNFFDPRPITLDEHMAWFRNYLDDSTRYDFMIVDSKGMAIGTVGLSHIDNVSCEANYMVGEASARGKGYATEALRAITELAFRELDVRRVEARILSGNEASAKVALGGGFVEYERVFICKRSRSALAEQQ